MEPLAKLVVLPYRHFAGERWLVAYLPFLAGCASVFLVSSMSKPPIPEALIFRFSDKLMHAAAFAILGATAAFGAACRRQSTERSVWREASLAAFTYGVLDEIHQAFVPGRSATVSDAVADGLGAMAGAYVLLVVLGALLAAPRTSGVTSFSTSSPPRPRSSSR